MGAGPRPAPPASAKRRFPALADADMVLDLEFGVPTMENYDDLLSRVTTGDGHGTIIMSNLDALNKYFQLRGIF